MANAAEKVFGIHELLEQILLESCISKQRIFTLQRVNKQFKSTIATSFYVKGKIGLLPITERHRAKQIKANDNKLISPLLRSGKLELRPFTVVVTEKKNNDGNDVVVITAEAHIDMVQVSRSMGGKIGLRSRTRVHGGEGTWALAELTLRAATILIESKVFNGGTGVYHERVKLGSEVATLRDLMSLLEAAMKRSIRGPGKLTQWCSSDGEGRVSQWKGRW